jgi:hypothetical protein
LHNVDSLQLTQAQVNIELASRDCQVPSAIIRPASPGDWPGALPTPARCGRAHTGLSRLLVAFWPLNRAGKITTEIRLS